MNDKDYEYLPNRAKEYYGAKTYVGTNEGNLYVRPIEDGELKITVKNTAKKLENRVNQLEKQVGQLTQELKEVCDGLQTQIHGLEDK